MEGGVEVEDLALAEAGAGDSVEAFVDGGGHIRNMDMDYHTLVMDCPMQLTAGATGILGALMPIHTPPIHLGTFQRHT